MPRIPHGPMGELRIPRMAEDDLLVKISLSERRSVSVLRAGRLARLTVPLLDGRGGLFEMLVDCNANLYQLFTARPNSWRAAPRCGSSDSLQFDVLDVSDFLHRCGCSLRKLGRN